MKRRRRSVEEIQALCARLRQSNLSQREFAADIGVSVGTIQNWLRRHRSLGLVGPARLVEVAPIPDRPTTCGCRIELPAGVALVCRDLPEATYIAELIRRLRIP